MNRLAHRTVLPAILAAAVLGLPACDEETPVAPTPSPTPSPGPARFVLNESAFDQFTPDVYVAIPLPLSLGGILDVTVDWTFEDSWIYVYIARGTCDFEQLVNKTCSYLVASETQFPKPRFLATEPIAPGTYSLILYNVPLDRRQGIGSDRIEAVSFQLGLTVGVPVPAAVSRVPVNPVFIRPR